MLQGRRVLVTGAGGFIGSHLVERLVNAGACVRALLRYNAEASVGNLRLVAPDALAGVKIVHGDLNDGEFVKGLVDGCDIVFHLGALIAIPYSYSAPRSYLNTNVGGTLNVLEAVRACGTPTLVHTSTSEVYGSARYIPIDEAHPLQAQSPYAATKIAADKLVEAYVRSFNIRAVIVRPFNTFGPRQSARAVIPTVIGQALGRPEVIRLGSTTPIRDLTYVSDTVAGFVAAATCEQALGGCYNLGTGQSISIGDLAQTILHTMGVSARIEADPDRMRPEGSEVDRLIASNAAFRSVTGWHPEVDIQEGVRRTVAFFQAHPDLLPRSGYVR
jgi:NAD dependent epimerase/dehydratase